MNFFGSEVAEESLGGGGPGGRSAESLVSRMARGDGGAVRRGGSGGSCGSGGGCDVGEVVGAEGESRGLLRMVKRGVGSAFVARGSGC